MGDAVQLMSLISTDDHQGKLAILRSMRLAMLQEALRARSFVASGGVSALKRWLESASLAVSEHACSSNPGDPGRIMLEGLGILDLLPMTFPVLLQTKIGRVVTKLGQQL